MKYARLLAEFHNRAWALPEDLLLRMQEMLNEQASGVKWSDEEIRSRIADSNAVDGYDRRNHDVGFRYSAMNGSGASERRPGSSRGLVAIIPILGILSHRINLVSDISSGGGTSVQKLTAQFRQAMANEDCKAIVFDVDSPGGSVDGIPELASEIYEGRKQKRIVAVCNSAAFSAAYWLASAAGEVACVPSGQCGSIGVFMAHADTSKALEKEGVKITFIKAGKYKTEGNSAEPLSDEARASIQNMVDDFYGMFVKSVARGRGTSQTAVREGYGQGRPMLAADAVKQNLVNRVATFDDVLAELLGGSGDFRRSLRRRQLEFDALQLGLKTSAVGTSDFRPAMKLRQRQLELDALRRGPENPRSAPAYHSEALERRRRRFSLHAASKH